MDRKKIFMVSLGHLSCDINGGALPAALPYLRSAHNLDYQAAGGLILAYSCLSSIIQPFFGLLSDRHSKPWFIPLGIALAGCGLAIMGFMGNYWAIFCGIAISGIGSAFFHPEGARFANRVSGKNKGAGISFFSIGGNSGFIIGPLLVTVFVGYFGLPGMAAFGCLSLFMALLLLAGISHMPGKKQGKPVPEILEKEAAMSAEDPLAAEVEELAEKKQPSIKKAENNWPEFSKLLGVIISRAIIFTGCNTFIPLFWVSSLGLSKTSGAIALVIFGASGIGFNILGGLLADKFGYVRIIRVAFSIAAPIVFLFGLAENPVLAYCLLPFLGLALYLPFSSQVVLGQKLLAKNIGFASGVTLGLATTLGGILQPVLGWIADIYGLNAIFFCLACIGLMGMLFSWLLRGKAENA